MKTKLRLSILGIAVLFLASQIQAQDVHAFTTSKTNLETQSIYITDIYTRDGMTNLVCRTKLKRGSIQIRIQQIYCDGKLLGEVEDDKVNKIFGTYAEANRPYDLAFQFYSDKTLRSVSIGTNGILADAFTCTNGVLFPLDSSTIKKANEIGTGMKELLDPKNVHGKTPEEFRQQVQEFIETNKNK